MDLTKYNNDLSDVTDYLSELGLSIDVEEFDGNYKKYHIPSVKFEIHIYSFIKQEDVDSFKYSEEILSSFEITRRFMSISENEKHRFRIAIRGDFSIINIMYDDTLYRVSTITNLKDLDNYLKENLPWYKRDNIIDNLLKD